MLQDYQSVVNATKNIHVVKSQSQGRVTQDGEGVDIVSTSMSKAWCPRSWRRHAHSKQLRVSQNSGNTGWRQLQMRCLYETSHTSNLIHCEAETIAWWIVLLWSKDGKHASVGETRTLSGVCRLKDAVIQFDTLPVTTQAHPDMSQQNIVWTIYIFTFTNITLSTHICTRPVKRNSSESFQCVVRNPSQHGRNAHTAPLGRRRWETAAVWFLALIEGHERVSNRITVDVTRSHRPARRHKAKTKVEKKRVSNERTTSIARTHVHLRHWQKPI